MKTLSTALLVSIMPFAAHAAGKTEDLVRAMRSEEIAVASVKRAFLSGALDDRFGRTSAACVKKVSWPDFTAGSVAVVESVLSPQEIDGALAFFQSPAGAKYVEGLVRRLRASQGEDSTLPPVKGKEEVTPEQMAAIAEFSRSDLGRKIMGPDMTKSPAALAYGKQIMDAIANRCAAR